MKGLSDERKEAKSANPSPTVQDELVAGGAAKTEHYEIAGSASLIDQTRAMGQTEAVQLLQQNLQQEERMLRGVDQLAQQMTQWFIAGAMRQGSQSSASQTVM